MSEFIELGCPKCGWKSVCGPTSALEWLRRAGMARRDAQPEVDLLGELLRAAADRLACPECASVGLSAAAVEEEDDEAWGMARACEGCGKPIAHERLEALPTATLCAGCQSKSESGEQLGPREFCPRCGNVMTLRKSAPA